VNPALERLTGYASAELIGQPTPFPWWIEETREVCRRNLLKSVHRGSRKYEQLFRRKNGKHFWVEIIFKTVEMNGAFNYHLENWVDLTERKRLRENMGFYISEITKAQEEERKRVAREIHDGTVQSLSALALDIDSMQRKARELPDEFIGRIKALRTKTNTILEELRHFSHELRPGIIDQVGLVAGLEILVEELNNQIGTRVNLVVTGPEQRLASEMELGLFRITQEALRNIRKHSKATEAEVKLKYARKRIKLNVTDNGHGFAVPETLGDLVTDNKLGLIGMQERVRLLNGLFRVKSHVGGGTRIEFEVET
jgi:PAS domain S-box-containing protein